MTQLSWHFTLEDLSRSDIATRKGLDNTPPPEAVENLKRLVNDVLQPVREWTGSTITVSSGYRCEELNRLVGSKATSAHREGRAADITSKATNCATALAFAQAIAQRPLNFDQCIVEFDSWVHVSVPKAGQTARRQLLSIDHQGTREGLHPARPKGAPAKVG